jgi:hypothetical protein
MAREQRKERRRLSHDDVRNNARESGGGLKYFNLPKGVGLWTPDKAGSYMLDFLPYEISIENHPDRRGDKVVPGDLWWKFPYAHHERIGPAQDSVVCPASFGKPCPICEEQARLKKNYDANKDAIRAINAKKQCAYVIRNPDDADAYAVFAYSMFKFGEILDAELTAVGDDALGFYDTTEEGKTVKVRFVDDSFDGRKFLKANRIDFESRKPMGFDDKRKDGTPFWNDDEIMEAVPCLDKIFIVNDYDALKKLFLQLPDPATAPKEPAANTSSAKTPAPKTPAPSKPPEKEPGTKFKKGDKVSFPDAKGKPQTGVVTEVEDDEVTIKTADGKLHEVDEDDVQPAPTEKEAPASADAAVFKKGDRVIDDEKRIGTVLKYDAVKDEVAVKLDEDDEKVTIDADDLEFYNHDEKEADDSDDEWTPAVGDEVSWDDGDEEGEIVKLHTTEPKAKVKNEAGDKTVWVALAELTKAE